MEQIRLIHCPLCNNADLQPFLNVQDHTVSGEYFKLEQCVSCGFVLTNPQPSPDKLGDYYKSSEYISHSGSKKGLINQLYHIVRKRAIRSKYSLIKKYTELNSLIDYGCGQGDFLKFCVQNNVNALGYEPDESTRNYAREFNKIPVQSISEYNSAKHSVDAITMWHVLEHIPDIKEILRKHHSNLKVNGILVIAVPNRNSFDALHYKSNWAAYDVPRHLWHFTKNDISALAQQTGFQLIEDHPMIYDSFYVSMLSEKYKKGKLIAGITIGLISNIKSNLNPSLGHSSRIYILKK